MPGLFRGDIGYSFGVPTTVAIAASPTGLVRASGGVVTVTTSANHNFATGHTATVGMMATGGSSSTSVGGTRFDERYTILTTPSATTATLMPVDPVVQHQAVDTGGAGTITSRAYETPAAPQAGLAYALAGNTQLSAPDGFAVDGRFSAAPGVFEVDVQVADTDADANYQTISNGNVTTMDATNFTFHFDCTFVRARFARVLLRTRTNAVGFICTIRG